MKTNLPKFRTTQVRDIKRTHSEFVKLADHLISSNPEAFVPAVPPALTSAGAGTDEDEARTKSLMQRWLNYVCGNDVLLRDDEMVFFVESDTGYSPMIRMKQPATGVRRKVIKQFAPPPDDTPELHDARPIVKQFYLGTMDTWHKFDKVVRSRRCMHASFLCIYKMLTEIRTWSGRVRPRCQAWHHARPRDAPGTCKCLPQTRKDHSNHRRLSRSSRHS